MKGNATRYIAQTSTHSLCCLVWILLCAPQLVSVKWACLLLCAWQLTGAEWHSSFTRSVCLSIPTCLSLPRLSGFCALKSVRQMGGRLFTCHLRDAQATQSAHNAARLNPFVKAEWRKGKARPRFSEASPPHPACLRLPSARLPFRRTLHLLFIPWNKAGPWREHTRSHTNGPPSVTGKSAIMEREGRDSWELHMSLREETTSPTRPGGGNEPAVHGL